jgi:hypothetical protein
LLIGEDGLDDLDGQGGIDTLAGGNSFDIIEDNGGTDFHDESFNDFTADWINAT